MAPTDRSSSVRIYVQVWLVGALAGVVLAAAWSGLTGHSGDFAYETTIEWHLAMVWKDMLLALAAAGCVLVFTAPLAPYFLRRFRVLTVLLAGVAPMIGLPIIGRFVPGVESAPTYYFTVFVLGGLLAGGVAGTIAVLATLFWPPSSTKPNQEASAQSEVDMLLGRDSPGGAEGEESTR